MKRFLIFFFTIAGMLAGSLNLQAQGDDVYYNPDDDPNYFGWHDGGTRYDPDQYYDDRYADDSRRYDSQNYNYDDNRDFDNRSFDNGNFDNRNNGSFNDQNYEYFDDYAYHYSSRIRRFHRPVYGAGFFDPFYVNMGFYDPFFNGPAFFDPFGPNMTIYVGVGFNNFGFNNFGFGFNRWNPWNPWNPWNRWNRWGMNGWGPGFGNTFVFNNFYGNGWGGNPYFSNAYCPPNYWVNTGGFTGETNTREVYYGPRKTRSGVSPNTGVAPRSNNGRDNSALREARLRNGRDGQTNPDPGVTERQAETRREALRRDEPVRTLNWGDEQPQTENPDRNLRRSENAGTREEIRMGEVPRTGDPVRRENLNRERRTETPATVPNNRYNRSNENRRATDPQRAGEQPTRRTYERPTRKETTPPSRYQRPERKQSTPPSRYERPKKKQSSPSRSYQRSRRSNSPSSYQRSNSSSRSSGASRSRSSFPSSRSSGASRSRSSSRSSGASRSSGSRSRSKSTPSRSTPSKKRGG